MAHRKSVLFCLAWIGSQAMLPSLQAQVSDIEKRFPWFAADARPASYPEILVGNSWLMERVESLEAVPLDVRSPALYEAGHLPGAIHWEASSAPSARGELGRMLTQAGIRRQQTLVLYGDDQDRLAIGQAYLALAGIGWEGVRVLDVSYDAWVHSGFPVETIAKERLSLPSVAAPSKPADSPFITLEELRASFGRAGFEVLDVRDAGGWGEDSVAPPLYAAGHVPHSLPFDARPLLPPVGWPDPPQVRERFAALGPRPSERVDLDATFLLYGTGPEDPNVGLTFLVLRMLGVSAKVFPAGFPEWTGDMRNPVVRILSAGGLQSLLTQTRKVNHAKKPQGSTGRLSPSGSFLLFDLREDWDFEEGHIPGARSLPERLFSERFEKIVRKSFPYTRRDDLSLVFYCYGRECTRSRNCATLAAQKGFRDLLWFRDGMEGWAEIDGPVETASSD